MLVIVVRLWRVTLPLARAVAPLVPYQWLFGVWSRRPWRPEPMDPEAAASLKALWPKPEAVCQHCGGLHQIACPRVKRVVFKGDGHLPQEVEYFERWPTKHIVFAHDLG